MSLIVKLSLLLLGLWTNLSLGGHYLFWLPMCSKSERIGVLEAGLELARRGHNITVVSPFRSNKETSGVSEIIIKSTLHTLLDEFNTEMDSEMLLGTLIKVSVDDNKAALTDPNIVKLLDKSDVDVLVTMAVFGNEAGYYLANKINASLVTFMPAPFSAPHMNWAIGEPFNPSYVPSALTGFTQHMNFQQRFINTLVTGAAYLLFSLYSRPKVENMLAEVFPSDKIPPLSSLAEDIALSVNHGSPFLGDGLRPVSPKSIMAALMTCRPGNPLPEDLKSFVDSAEDGVIYVSFGTVIKASKMPEAKRHILLSVFSKLKQKVIWKWDNDMPDAPSNVMISPWLPQPDLLAHPNVKLFITHGGAGSFQETICYKTPLVGIPIYFDGFQNMNSAVSKGIGLSIGWKSINENNLAMAIEEVLSNGAYKDAITKLKNLLLDQPQHPRDKVVWHMEYLLRHSGNKDMHSPALNLHWHQYFLLDVILVLVFVIATVIFIFYFIVKLTYSKCCYNVKTKRD